MQEIGGTERWSDWRTRLEGLTKSPYIYEPLPSEDSIRLSTSLESPHPYVALSYVWGNPKWPKILYVDGLKLDITKNLHGCIKCFIENGLSKLWFWIDAICIDQANTQERSQQVALTEKICEQASSVYVWLGPADADTEASAQILESWGPELEESAALLITYLKDRKTRDDRETEMLLARKVGSAGSLKDMRAWRKLMPIVDRPYRHRLWCVQESTTYAKTNFYCGTQRISRAWIYGLALWARYFKLQSTFTSSEFDIDWGKFDAIFEASYLLQQRKTNAQDVYSTLHILRPFSASDSRDKVFAGLPFAAIPERGFHIDYNLDLEKVYINTTDLLLQMYNSMDFWSEMRRPEVQSRKKWKFEDESLPSWVEDWRIADEAVTPFPRYFRSSNGSRRPIYAAAVPKDDSLPRRMTIEGRTLRVNALYIDTIEYIAKSESSSLNDCEMEFGWLQDYRRAINYGTVHCKPFNREYIVSKAFASRLTGSIPEVFARVLRLDINLDDEGNAISRNPTVPPKPITNPGTGTPELMKCISKDIISTGTKPWDDVVFRFVKQMTRGRKFMWTRKTDLGLVSNSAQVGDHIYLIIGNQFPHVLRQVPDGEGQYQLICEAYVRWSTDGEELRGLTPFDLKEILLV